MTPPPAATKPALKIVFVTDRNREQNSKNWTEDFGSKLLDQWSLTCGEVTFSADPTREFGQPYSLDHLDFDRKSYSTGDSCLAFIQSAIPKQSKNLIVLAHGYNNTFSDAIRAGVGFARDVDLDGLLLIWCWPSQGLKSAYQSDERANAWSTRHFATFFQTLIPTLQQKNIDFVAHSMGSHILLQFVSDANPNVLSTIRSVVFAAPDVDQEDFRARESHVASAFQTLYAFADDWPLYMSRLYHREGPRAGESGDHLLIVTQVESIDASVSGHSAIFQEPYVIKDFARLLERHQPATLRGLVEKTRGALKYYLLKQ